MSVTAVPLQPVKRAYKVWLWTGVLAAIALAFGLAWVGTRTAVVTHMTSEQFLAWNKTRSDVHTTASGLQYEVLKKGEGATAAEGDGVEVKTVGTKRDGTVFQPEGPIRLQVGGAIPGFDEALKLMNKGAKYRIWVPSSLGYDKAGPEHPLYGQLLIFDIELDNIVPAAVIQQMMMQQMMQQQQQGGPPPGAEGGPPPAGR
jgi:FKBP-type peptidyl-prolyl cis-trans isomerase FkpA